MNRRVADGVLVKVDVDGPSVFGNGATSAFAEPGRAGDRPAGR
ncbi:hypothetical protein [Nocardioides convexus]|nr:hypothetical protein [Nocardioides convexus]